MTTLERELTVFGMCTDGTITRVAEYHEIPDHWDIQLTTTNEATGEIVIDVEHEELTLNDACDIAAALEADTGLVAEWVN